MTGRDRIVLVLVIVAVLLVGVWIKVVSPERQKASKLVAQVATAKAQLESAEGQVSNAHTAQSQYASAYAAMVNLGKAVPSSQEVPALIDELTRASNAKNVEFQSIANGSAGSSSASSTSTSAASSTTGSTSSAAAVFTQLPFSFTFEGSYFDLEHLFRQLTDFATFNSAGNIEVNGRLLTISSVSLSPGTVSTGSASGSSSGSGSGSGLLTGTITASAYMLPESHGLSSSATGSSPAAAGASSASTASSASSPTAAAIVKVNP
jgi:Pilus assembly protein, PilO